MKRSPWTRLSLMMFLQYAVWGVWMPILARYLEAGTHEGGLGFTNAQVAAILGIAASIGAISAPFIAGQFADRRFSTERFLAGLLVIGGIIKIATAYQTTFSAWLWLSIAYSVVYMPTLSLTNSLAFAHLENPDRGFPYVRVWGTIGWIAASWLFPLFWLLRDVHFQWMPPFYGGTEVANVTGRLGDALIASGVISILFAVFALFLPHTPPRTDAAEPLAWKAAFALLRKRSLLVLVLASLPISIIHQVYFMQTAPFFSNVVGLRDSQIGPAMTIGQFAEIAVMVATGWLLRRLGFRWVIALGCLAYVVRYAIFASSLPAEVIVASQALHGLCYACFFAAAFIYVDRIAPEDVRASAQTVFGIIILGVGPVAASLAVKVLVDMFPGTGGLPVNYTGLWGALSVAALVTMLGFAAFFRDETGYDKEVA